MSRPNPIVLTVVLAVFGIVFGGFSIAQGGLYLDTHEGDTYHHLDILFRMKDGLLPHQDFVTPLGLFAFLPIVLFMQSGLGVGMSILWAQAAVALLLLPAAAYAAASRLPRLPAYGFGLFVIGLVLALTYGGSFAGVSISMHYNRWAWAVSFVLLVLAMLPALGRPRAVLDGVLMGMLAAALLLLKITFFVCLVPIAGLALLWRGDRVAFVAALVGGLAVLGALTLIYGAGHWSGYLHDLRLVAGTEVRPFVGVTFDQIVAGPQYIGGTILAILSVLLLRRTGYAREGTLLLILLPAFLYITYQNFGNDPKWLAFLSLLLLACRPQPGDGTLLGADLSQVSSWLAVTAIALFAPSLFNLALSPMKHAAIQSAQFLPMVTHEGGEDIFVRIDRANTMSAEVHLDETSPVWAKYAEDAGRAPTLEVGGVEIGHCELFAGSRALLVEIAADLEDAGIPEGSQFFTTDVLTAFWLFGPFAPLQGGAPWYYGGLSGLENADYVLVPKCSFLASLRRIMADDMAAAGVDLTPVRDTELYTLFSIGR